MATQAKWNVDTGEIFGVGSKHNERPQMEVQLNLLMWLDEQKKKQEWEEAQKSEGEESDE
jgi:hypothetical protein